MTARHALASLEREGIVERRRGIGAHRIIRVLGEDLVFHVDFLNERNLEDELNLVGGRGGTPVYLRARDESRIQVCAMSV
jgi:hypothetical protein